MGVATARELLMRHPNLKIGIFEKESSIGILGFGLYPLLIPNSFFPIFWGIP